MTTDDDQFAQEAAQVGRAYARTKRAAEDARHALRSFVLMAYATGHGYAEIARATGHVLTPARVQQIVTAAQKGESPR